MLRPGATDVRRQRDAQETVTPYETQLRTRHAATCVSSTWPGSTVTHGHELTEKRCDLHPSGRRGMVLGSHGEPSSHSRETGASSRERPTVEQAETNASEETSSAVRSRPRNPSIKERHKPPSPMLRARARRMTDIKRRTVAPRRRKSREFLGFEHVTSSPIVHRAPVNDTSGCCAVFARSAPPTSSPTSPTRSAEAFREVAQPSPASSTRPQARARPANSGALGLRTRSPPILTRGRERRSQR
jgi:hypothetical protein